MSEIVRTNGNGDRIKEILQEVENLNAEQKAELLRSLLGQTPSSGVQVVFGNGGSVWKADLVVQINSSDSATLQTIVSAIANRIEKPLN